jgi:hypothetical protein
MDAASTSEGIQLDETAASLWRLKGPVEWPDAVLPKNPRSQTSGREESLALVSRAGKDRGAARRNYSEFWV